MMCLCGSTSVPTLVYACAAAVVRVSVGVSVSTAGWLDAGGFGEVVHAPALARCGSARSLFSSYKRVKGRSHTAGKRIKRIRFTL